MFYKMNNKITQFIVISLIASKVIYILIDIYIAFEIYQQVPIEEIKILQSIRNNVLSLSEIFIYMLFVIIFNPIRKNVAIHVTRTEQLLFFVLGVLALLHFEWNIFKQNV